MKRRLLAALMCVCMIIGLMPATAMAAPRGNYPDEDASTVEAKFYYKLDNQVPTNPEEGSDVQAYGPSGDNTPLITVAIDMEKLFDSLPSNAQKTARESWWVNEGSWIWTDYQEHGYATAKSCGYTNNADWWKLVISCMDSEGQDYFKNNLFGQMFQGYAIKYEPSDYGAFHCDGILTKEPPVYLAELYDTDKGHFVAAMAGGSENDSNLSIGNVQKVYTKYLTGSKESDQVNWTSSGSGIYTDSKGDSYQLTLSFTPPMQGNALDFTKERENYYRAIVILTKEKIPTYKVTYNVNDGMGSVPQDNTAYRTGATVNVKFTPAPTRTGYTFLGWDTNPNAQEPTYKQDGTTSFKIQQKTTLYAIWKASNPALSVTKSVYQVNGQNYTTGSKVAVDDTIVYQIVVQNIGNVPLSNIAVSDTLGSQPLTVYSDASCTNVATAISSLAPNGTVTYYAKYQVAAADAGQTLTNTATASTGTTTNNGSVAVKVKGQPTITVIVENGTASAANLNNGKITLTEGGDATITFTANEKYVLDSVTVNEKPANLTENTYSFTNVTTDQTIKVVYALDNNGDGTADKYQVTINYVAGEGGSLQDFAGSSVPSPSSRVVTIEDKNGNPTSTGKVKISMKAVPGSNYFFKDWTKKVDNETETQYTTNQTLSGELEVTGGTVVTFTANFAPKTYKVVVDKTVTNDQGHKTLAIVGDTLSYTIQVTNNSNVSLENAVLTDSMWGTGKVTSVKVNSQTVDVSNGSYNITNLNVGSTITITYDYTVSKADLDEKTQSGLISNEARVLVNGQQVGRDAAETTAIGDVIVTPADITIYMGGHGYDQVVDDDGNLVNDQQNGLPVPGFYVTLPQALDQKLKAAVGVDVNDTLDLSQYLTFGNGEKSWSLALYDGDNTHKVDGKYIYRMEAAEGQDPVRMQFTDDAGVTHVDDELDLQNALYSKYTMEIYPGKVNPGTVKATLDTTKNSYPLSLEAKAGTLTIRGVTEEGETNAVTSEVTGTVNEVTAVADPDTTYTINDSDILAVNPNPALLVDSVAYSETSEKLLAEKALDTLNLGSSEGLNYEFYYLDLVDTANGNTWITPSQPVKVYWPYPAGTNENTEFYLVHFKDLDREMNADNVESEIAACDTESITVGKDEHGIYFMTQSFSPFALVYNTPENVTVTFKSGEHGHFAYGHTQRQVELDKGDSLTQIPYVFEDEGYEFIGWYENGSGSWHLYSDEDLLKMEFNSDATFIAQYKYVGGPSVDDDYDVVYNANFTDGGVPRRQGYDKGETVTVSENKWFERDGYIFVGWNTEADGTGDSYDPDDTFKMPGRDVYLYAQWQKEKPGPDDTGVSRWLETEDHNAYLTGYPDSTFGADRNMTRAEVAQMFYALLKNKNVMITTSFSDVSNDAWYATAVKTMASLGMMSGYPDGTFRPDEPITRAEFATVALAFAYAPDNARCSYLDVSTSAWYYTYVAQATTYGWIGGYPDGTFRPNNSITRVEVCVIVNNMLGRTPDEDYIDRNEDELVNFVDLSDRYWGYYTIMEATNGHEYTGNYSNETWKSVK